MLPNLTDKLREFIETDKTIDIYHNPQISIIGATVNTTKSKSNEINNFGLQFIHPKQEIYCSKSHTKDKLISVIASTPIGIDIETIRDNAHLGKERILAPAEEQLIPFFGDDLNEALTILWSCKESCFKAFGKDQPQHPSEITLQLENDKLFGSYGDKKARVYLFSVDEFVITITFMG